MSFLTLIHLFSQYNSILTLSTLSLYCYDHIRELHSFPTRRSSDLLQSPEGWFCPGIGQQTSFSGCNKPPPGYRSVRSSRDRKSTRLNSSHVAISYAVFCLKKKMKHMKKEFTFVIVLSPVVLVTHKR